MGLLDKVKNLFTEEVEEEIKPIKKEVRHIEVEAPKRAETKGFEIEDEPVEEKKEEKFVFFSDDDFKDLDKPVLKEIPEVKEEKKEVYRSQETYRKKENYRQPEAYNPIKEEEKKNFKPSPIISPVYGVLDKNYSKDEVVSKKVTTRPTNRSLSVDDIRKKAYGTIEDELKDTILGVTQEKEEVQELNDIDIFEELEKYDNLDALEEKIEKKDIIDVDDLFDSLDNKKEEILGELDNKKDEILDELDNKKDDIIITDEDLDFDEETLELSRQLENQKKKLDEINDFIPEEEIEDDKLIEEDDLNESELFDLIDSMYEKRDDE